MAGKMEIKGAELMAHPELNKATGFSKSERQSKKLEGLLPARVETIEEQSKRMREILKDKGSPLEKFLILRTIKASNLSLFYRLLIDEIEELSPLVYTPTVGSVCLNYSLDFIFPEGLYLNAGHQGSMKKILDNLENKEIDVAVVTDGSRILGLGDLGLNGMGIPVGKLDLYISCAGFHPCKTLPVVLDVGTNNEKYLKDPFYLGLRQKRIGYEKYLSFMDEFMSAIKEKFPKILIQFEDFASPYCFHFLERYRNQALCFNDDIQGTGAVVLGGFINALKIQTKPLSSQKILILGAGSAGTSVGEALVHYLQEKGKMSEEEARRQVWLLDSQGMITTKRGVETLNPQKRPFARKEEEFSEIRDLEMAVEKVRPSMIIGLAGKGGAFSKKVLERMAEINERPIIFPLSNPTEDSECTFQEAIGRTKGKVIFASGSPFDPIEWEGKKMVPGQGNNMYVFPGIALGVNLSQSKKVTQSMMDACSETLAACVSPQSLEEGMIYPSLSQIRKVSAEIALAVMKVALQEDLAQNGKLKGKNDHELAMFIQDSMFQPSY